MDAERGMSLAQALEGVEGGPGAAAARVVIALATAARDLAAVIARPTPGERLGAATGGANTDGDAQRKLDIIAEDLCRDALMGAGVGPYLSEEADDPMILDPQGSVAVAIDPLDGSSNIDVNGVIGTIFSVLPAEPGKGDPAAPFLQGGRGQLAAGFFVYGPKTTLVVSLGAGVDVFALDPAAGEFVLVERGLKIPLGTAEYAINASNHRHWTAPVRDYIDDCIRGADGPHGRNFNMRWCPTPSASSPAAGCSCTRRTAARGMRRAAFACSTRRARSPSWPSRPAAAPPTASDRSSTSSPSGRTSARR
jgi:fructose-1,6-bisphosphatase I